MAVSLLFLGFISLDGFRTPPRRLKASVVKSSQSSLAVGSAPKVLSSKKLTATESAAGQFHVATSTLDVAEAQLVPDDGSSIAELLLLYSSSSERELGPVYEDLFRSLPGDVRLVVCCPDPDSVEYFVSVWGPAAMAGGRDVHVVNVNRPLSVWARDRRIARQTATGEPVPSFVPTAHAGYDEEKHNDLLLQGLLWPTGLVPRVALSSFHLEGGNVVSNRKHVFIGNNVLEENSHKFPEREMLIHELGRIFGREPILIRDDEGNVPWCHTDMYLTPIDTETILLASPADGLALLGGVAEFTTRVEDEASDVSFNLTDENSPLQQQFDMVERQLEAYGYQVVRMPALVNVEEEWMVTYNNVLMEQSHDRRAVYVPEYGIEAVDEAAYDIYRRLGFTVYPIDVSTVYQLGGAVRCLSNVTVRYPHSHITARRSNKVTGSIQTYEVEGYDDEVQLERTIDSTRRGQSLDDTFGNETFGDEKLGEENFREENFREENFRDENFRDENFGEESFRNQKSSGAPKAPVQKFRKQRFGDERFGAEAFETFVPVPAP